MKNLEDEVERRKRALAPHYVPLPTQDNSEKLHVESRDFIDSKKRKTPFLYDEKNREHLDALIARMFFTTGLLFNLARNPYFIKAFQFAANNKLSGYISLSYNKLRTTSLEQEKSHVGTLLQPSKATWKEKGVTIVSDWSDPQRRTLINFMATTRSGAIFIQSVNCSSEVKDKHFIANLLKEVIDEVGEMNIVQVIIDNASNCKGVVALVEGIYPWIYWTPCVVHTLNLALKNICAAKNVETNQDTYVECLWITQVHDDVVQVKYFIMIHSMILGIFNKFSSLKWLAIAVLLQWLLYLRGLSF